MRALLYVPYRHAFFLHSGLTSAAVPRSDGAGATGETKRGILMARVGSWAGLAAAVALCASGTAACASSAASAGSSGAGGGAGATVILMSLGLRWVGVPLATALPAVVAYRIANLVLPAIPAIRAHQRVERRRRLSTRRRSRHRQH